MIDNETNEGLRTCTACGGHGSTDENLFSYCCCEPTVERDFTKEAKEWLREYLNG
jgi:hypothetical protein